MRVLFLTTLLGLLAGAPAVQAGKAHSHGEGRLDVVIEKDGIQLQLDLPLDAAAGFERAPKNDKEQAALAAAEKALNEAASLFVPTAAAGCSVQSAQVTLPALAKQGEHHADITASYTFRCATPAALKGIETTIFRPFPRLYRLETQRAGPAGQGRQRLTPKAPVVTW